MCLRACVRAGDADQEGALMSRAHAARAQTNSFKDLYPEVLDADKLPMRQAHRLPEDVIVFCTFNRLGRITPDILEVVAHSAEYRTERPLSLRVRVCRCARFWLE